MWQVEEHKTGDTHGPANICIVGPGVALLEAYSVCRDHIRSCLLQAALRKVSGEYLVDGECSWILWVDFVADLDTEQPSQSPLSRNKYSFKRYVEAFKEGLAAVSDKRKMMQRKKKDKTPAATAPRPQAMRDKRPAASLPAIFCIPDSYRPFDRISLSFKTMPTSSTGFRRLMVICNEITRFLIYAPLKLLNVETICEALIEKVFCIFGPPSCLVTDAVASLTGKLLTALCRTLNID